MTDAAYDDVRALAYKLAGFTGLDPEATIRGDALRAEMLMRLRAGVFARGMTGANINMPRAWMNFVPSAEAMLARDPAILSRIALGYELPMRGRLPGTRT